MGYGIGRPGFIRFMMPLFMVLACSACAAKRFETCDKPPPFYLRLEASERVNPDPRGRSMPTLVQILQLRDSIRAEQSSFRDLWGKPEALLKEDLLQVAEFTVAPGQEVARWIPRDPKTQFVVAMGLFRQPLGYSWRTLTMLPSVPKHLCTDEPVGQRGPRATDAQLRFKLEGYQIDLLRASPSSMGNPALDNLQGGTTPHWSKS
ncbi:type VI secretion system-associated lipoprotein [Cystobacter ferrugineus]|uniref:Type VI secretion system-associated lipoprotein n=2 Tax=Cystobacter ferrugineus TaxID=83449 RepID=A0A1L9B7C3_9BACT|nr:type VI secretion system-associated lipoprotein [Cystobacter ferrugineus]